VTIVAAWIRAETGVGPSMASGSQVWSGSCADFAKAPTRISRQAATIVPSFMLNASPACWNTGRKSSDPTLSRIRNAAITRAMSPITLMTNALMPAYTAVERRYQNEIRRYDAAPTNAHPMIRITKLAARTSSSIEKTK
jgi:hypothetical protein